MLASAGRIAASIAHEINNPLEAVINMLGGGDFDRAIVNTIVRPWLLDKFSLPNDMQADSRFRRLMGMATRLNRMQVRDLFVSSGRIGMHRWGDWRGRNEKAIYSGSAVVRVVPLRLLRRAIRS